MPVPYLPSHRASSSGGGSDFPRQGSGAGSIRPQLCPPLSRTRQKRLRPGTAAGREGGSAPRVRTVGGKRRQEGAVLRSERAVLPGAFPVRPESASGRQWRRIPELRPRRPGSPPPPPFLPHPTQLPPLRPRQLGNRWRSWRSSGCATGLRVEAGKEREELRGSGPPSPQPLGSCALQDPSVGLCSQRCASARLSPGTLLKPLGSLPAFRDAEKSSPPGLGGAGEGWKGGGLEIPVASLCQSPSSPSRLPSY